MSFRREANIPRGGPNGGDGGQGGHVIIRAEENIGSLAALAGHHHWRAESGQHGQGQLKTGRSGQDAVISVPPGTLVRDAGRGHLLRDLVDCDQQVVVAQGGKGGLGNKRFATSTNRHFPAILPSPQAISQPARRRLVASFGAARGPITTGFAASYTSSQSRPASTFAIVW